VEGQDVKALLLALAFVLLSCSEPYRVGEYVLVEWEAGKVYPAYIVEISGKARYRVHFDGYDSRWDEDVGIDRIKGRVEGPVAPLPPPAKVARASQTAKPPADTLPGAMPSASTSASAGPGGASVLANPYKPGDRVRLTWRGSIYSATVLEVVAKDKLLVHYEGHESVWDEVVHVDRIASKRP
jgi:hypothetical protein